MQMKWMKRIEESFKMGTFGVGSNAEITKSGVGTSPLPSCGLDALIWLLGLPKPLLRDVSFF